MIDIMYLKNEKGSNRFGTCSGCGKNTDDDPMIRRIRVGYDNSNISACLCRDCFKALATDVVRNLDHSDL